MRIILWVVVLLLSGCDQIQQRMGFPDPAQVEADGKAIGGACRNAGRGLEDCFHLNSDASKAAVYAGWKDMNEYMARNNMQVLVPKVSPDASDAEVTPKAKKAEGDGEAKKPPATKNPPDTKHKSDGGKDAGN